jgi:hypothetical protein
MSLFLAAVASQFVNVDGFPFIGRIFFLIPGCVMLLELATESFFGRFSTAPPHFARPLRLMGATTPVEIFSFVEILSTELANQYSGIDTTFFSFQLYKSFFHSFYLLGKGSYHFVQLNFFRHCCFNIRISSYSFSLLSRNLFFEIFDLNCISQVYSQNLI